MTCKPGARKHRRPDLLARKPFRGHAIASVIGAQRMNRTALTNIAPDIFRKRLLVEGYFRSDMAESVLRDYFRHITS
jgi:hypothetical protein